jgi:hypothetical protein
MARKGGFSIAPPPPILGGTSDALHVNSFWWQLHQAGWQEAQKANPDWAKVGLGVVASPLGYLEEGLLRPIVNVPHTALNNVIMAGQHLDRSYLWLQQDEWGDAVAEGLEAVINLSLAFLDIATLLEPLKSKSGPASLAREIPASVPQDSPAMVKPQLTSALPTEAGRRAAIAVGDLGAIGSATSRQSFRRLLISIISQPSHPLHGLLNAEGRLTSSTARGMNELIWFENPNILEAGHLISLV